MELDMSTMNKTWILDLDGTLLKHNGYKLDGFDTMLPGAEELLSQIKDDDMVIIVTSREESSRQMTEEFLEENGIRYNHIIFEAPYGERILINDNKPSGLKMAYSISGIRDEVPSLKVTEDPNL